ncbi:hypothetical protein [Formosa sp. S-31]|uniref:hypothetical protein n=1 Tax=Formosa sp. S-31 TaxID=2790949 RepID=UPI003EC0FA68
MKKVVIAAALVFGSFSLITATNSPLNNTIEVAQDNFKEIAVSDLPIAVTDAVAADFSEATIAKAYVNDAKEYKLILSIDGDFKTIYANESGEWINM